MVLGWRVVVVMLVRTLARGAATAALLQQLGARSVTHIEQGSCTCGRCTSADVCPCVGNEGQLPAGIDYCPVTHTPPLHELTSLSLQGVAQQSQPSWFRL